MNPDGSAATAGAERIVVLYTCADPSELRTFEGPPGRCAFVALEAFDPEAVAPAPVVVVTGHSLPPEYLHRTADEVAAAVAALDPELIVLDTCYGFSTPLLDALAARLSAWVVGPTVRLPLEGLDYSPRFFDPRRLPPAERARAVRTRSGAPLARMALSREHVAAIHAEVATWSPDRLERNLQRVLPNLVRVPVPDTDAVALVHVEPARFHRPEATARPVAPADLQSPHSRP